MDGMDDIELLKLENRALRFQNQTLLKTTTDLSNEAAKVQTLLLAAQDELHVLRRFRKLVERGAEIVKKLPVSVFTEFRAGL